MKTTYKVSFHGIEIEVNSAVEAADVARELLKSEKRTSTFIETLDSKDRLAPKPYSKRRSSKTKDAWENSEIIHLLNRISNGDRGTDISVDSFLKKRHSSASIGSIVSAIKNKRFNRVSSNFKRMYIEHYKNNPARAIPPVTAEGYLSSVGAPAGNIE